MSAAGSIQSKRAHLLARLLLALLLVSGGPVRAQEGEAEVATPAESEAAAEDAEAEPEEPAEPPLVVEGRELMAGFAARQEQLDALRREARNAKGEQHLVLSRQIAELRVEMLRDVSAIVDNVVAQREAELEADEIFEQTRDLLDRMVPSIVGHIDAADKRLRRLRQRREGAEETELLEIEQAIAGEVEWAVTLYRAYADTVDDMSALGIDASREREDLVESLSASGASLAARIDYQIERITHLQAQLASRPDDADLKLRLDALEARRERSVRTLSAAIRLYERLQIPATELQQLQIRATGEVTADIFKKEVALGLVDQSLEWAQEWLRDNGPDYGFKLLIFLAILLVFRILAGLVRVVLVRALASERVDASKLLQDMTVSLSGNAVIIFGVLVGLSQLGLELGPILAGLGIAGFIVGFALQDSLSNLAAGVMILGVRPYDVGDMIEAAGVFGEVSHMSLIATTILTIDNQTLVVPNARIWGDVIKNVTHQQERRIDMTFRIAYSEDTDRVEKVLADILASDERVLEEPAPMLKVHKLNEWSVDFIVRPWVKTADYWDVYWDLTREVKRRFEQERITIPMPRSEVQLVPGAESETR